MSNTLGTVNGAVIVQEALTTALEIFPILNQVRHDFSPGAARWNQTVNFGLVTAASTGTYSTSTGYASQNQVQTDKQVTINTHPYCDITIDDQERSQSEVELIKRFSPVVAHALFKSVVTKLFALVHTANFTNDTQETAITDIDRDTLIEVQTQLDDRDCPTMDRYCVLNPAAYGELLKDTSVVSQDYRGEKSVQTGRFGLPIQGFDVQMYSSIDTSENLKGFAGWRDALLLATRVPESPQVGTLPGTITTVTEPRTGLSAQTRQWYDFGLGKERLVCTLMYGVAVGNAEFLETLTTSS